MSEIAPELQQALSDRYRIERELGRGGMSVVFLAEDLKHARQVALKVLAPELGQALGSERFLREIRIAAKLSHPRILPVLDSGSVAGHLFYAMPYIDGESLRSRLDRERQLPLDEALDIARQVASALAFAHKRGIVHRDIKPGNIMLSGSEAVVADFGIARAVTAAGGTRLTQTGLVVGTPLYMSPEQASSGGDTDARSDIYSLACVLYEMLAGEPPFEAKTAPAITARKLTESAPDIRSVREAVPAPVATTIAKALARLPADRYRSAGEFAEELRRGGSEPVPQATVPAADRGIDHHEPFALPDGRGILFVPHRQDGTGALEVFTGGERRELLRIEGQSLHDPVYSATGHILFSRPGGIWAVPFSLRRLEVTGEPFLGRQLAFVRADGQLDGLVGDPVERGGFFALSPSGREIATAFDEADGIWVLDPVTGTRSRPTAEGEAGNFPRWSPDGQHIAYWSRGRTADDEYTLLLRAADGTGPAREVARGWYPTFTPDGRGMLMTLGAPQPDEGWHIGYVDLDRGGDPEALVATSAWECCQDISPDGRHLAYASNTTGRWEVYVTRFPSAEGRWQVSTEGGSWPRWEDPGGGRLFYAQDVDIMAVQVSTEPSLSLAEPEVLFSRPARAMDIRFGLPDPYDVTPDGERFLVMLPGGIEGEGQTTVVVMGDWPAAVERQ